MLSEKFAIKTQTSRSNSQGEPDWKFKNLKVINPNFKEIKFDLATKLPRPSISLPDPAYRVASMRF